MDVAVDRARAEVRVNARFVVGDAPVPLIRHRTQAQLDASAHARGMPLGAHAMLVGWTADALAGAGVACQIVWSTSGRVPIGAS